MKLRDRGQAWNRCAPRAVVQVRARCRSSHAVDFSRSCYSQVYFERTECAAKASIRASFSSKATRFRPTSRNSSASTRSKRTRGPGGRCCDTWMLILQKYARYSGQAGMYVQRLWSNQRKKIPVSLLEHGRRANDAAEAIAATVPIPSPSSPGRSSRKHCEIIRAVPNMAARIKQSMTVTSSLNPAHCAWQRMLPEGRRICCWRASRPRRSGRGRAAWRGLNALDRMKVAEALRESMAEIFAAAGALGERE